ncbi:MAG: ATP-binding protein [Candidatus Limnocylindrales bacterium]|jgi:signal transduction histidine kinase/HAMP domain-containing protein
MSRLPLRSRLFLALATVALLPVVLFGVVAIVRVTASTSEQQQSSLLNLARLAVAESPQGNLPDATAASRLAALTGGSVTVFGIDGRVIASSGPETIAALPSDWAPSPGGSTIQVGSLLAGVVPLAGAAGGQAGYLALVQPQAGPADVGVVLAVALVVAVIWAVFLSFALARALIQPLRELTATLDRLQTGDLSARLVAPADDELGRLANSHNRLAAALDERNRSLHQVLEALAGLSQREGPEALVADAERAATRAFGFRSVRIVLAAAAPTTIPAQDERVPGEAFTVVAPLRLEDDDVGWLTAVVPPVRDWSPADADLLALYGRQLAAAVRNAELYQETRSLSELKSEFLRGVSHNLQTPLTSIRAFAERLADRDQDPALRIIVEQADRLSRLVGQLLTVSRLEAGTLRPREEVVALAPLVRRAWESLAHDEISFSLKDEAGGWLALVDRDWVDQVVWALLDNAVKHGGGTPVEMAIRAMPAGSTAAGTIAGPEDDLLRGNGLARAPTDHFAAQRDRLVVFIRDHGPGISEAVRVRLFDRFAPGPSGGTGLGLNVARGLLNAMGGDIWIEPCDDGAAFAFAVPAEAPEEI